MSSNSDFEAAKVAVQRGVDFLLTTQDRPVVHYFPAADSERAPIAISPAAIALDRVINIQGPLRKTVMEEVFAEARLQGVTPIERRPVLAEFMDNGRVSAIPDTYLRRLAIAVLPNQPVREEGFIITRQQLGVHA